MWEFEILSSATTQAIPPCDPDTKDDELDNVLSPVDLHQITDCNCLNLLTNPACLVSIHTHRMLEDKEVKHVDISAVNGETEPGAGNVDEMEEIQHLTEIMDMDDNEHDEDINDKLEGEQNRNGNTGIDGMYPEKGVISEYPAKCSRFLWIMRHGYMATFLLSVSFPTTYYVAT